MSKREISKVAAKILINIGAINFSPQSPLNFLLVFYHQAISIAERLLHTHQRLKR